jgi:predicted permease
VIARLYRMTLWLFPREFRARFEPEIIDTSAQLDRDQGGTPRAVIAAFADVIGTAIALRIDPRAYVRDPSPTRSSPMESFFQDVRFALRGLRRDPVFAAFAIATLGLGIGANAAMFGIVDRLLLRGPDHVARPSEVVRLYVSHHPEGMRRFTGSTVGHVMYDLVRQNASSFSAVATYANNEATLGRGETARPIRAGYVSGTFFGLLGAVPSAGRFFAEADDDPRGAARVVVLGHETWTRQFGAREDIVGQTVIVADEPHTVIGVAPAGFTGADIAPVDVWLPMNLKSPYVTTDWQTAWDAQWLNVIGRLRADVTPEQANAELTRVFRTLYTGDEASMKTANILVAPLRADGSGSEAMEARVARWLMGVAAVMLLIVCANVINLLLARAVRREREIAIRLALGSSRGRLRRLLLIESMVLGVAGALLGIAIAYVLGGIARQSLLTNIVWTSSPVDARVLAVTTMIAIVSGLVVGLVPAMRAGGTSLTTSLRTGAGEGGGRRAGLRASLTIAQAALSVALLIGAGLFIRSLVNVRNLPLGIEPDRVLIAEIRRASVASMPEGPTRDAERARRRSFAQLSLEQLRQVSGVTHAAVAVGMPFGNRFTVRVRVPGRDSMPRLTSGGPSISAVSDEYFATVGTRIIRGRPFTTGDRAGSERVTIVSETMARTVWPDVDALGQCLIAISDTLPCARVVGIAEDTHRSALREDPTMHYYIPLGQEVGFGGSVILVRGVGDPRVLGPGVTRALLGADASITLVDLQTIQDRIDPQMQSWKLGTAVLTSVGILALLVAVVGIYSVTSYLVMLRRHEIGVRVALGATGRDVVRLVLDGGMLTAVAGVMIGSALALVGGRFIEPLLFDVSSRDPVVFGSVALTLIVASGVACIIPALRANRISPVDALRSE